MYPHAVQIFSATVSIWNALFVVAVVAGYFVFRRTLLRAAPRMTAATLRYSVVVYLSALAAQVFAYAFDTNTSLTPPPGVSALSWFLNPVAGPKTLYGVIVLMPVSVGVATVGTGISLLRGLDLFTPAMFVVLAIARVGCFLQGCCYGKRSEFFGISFPVGSPVYHQQFTDNLVTGSWSLPVVPTQGVEALFLACVAAWSWRERPGIEAGSLFVSAIAAYSIFRLVIEFLRADVERGIYGPLATSQWIALAVLIVISGFVTMRGRIREA